ncbi:MAG: HD domain-containing protein [Spirochaetes bacterium]|nr:HD domain-containing protein [Spirochaetota bacterium]
MNATPLYNSRIFNTYLKYLKKKHPHVDTNRLLEHAGIKPYEVADESHWFTQEQANRFHEILTSLTGNANIAREAGRYAAGPESIGVMRQYILGFLNPAKVYEIIEKAARQFTRSTTFTYKKIDSKKIEITATPLEGVTEQPFQCENRMGHFESIALVFNNRTPKIEHPECVFKGGKMCRYIISWESNLLSIFRRLRNILAIMVPAAGITLTLLLPFSTAMAFLFPAAAALFLLAFYCDFITKKELRSSLMNRESTHDELLKQMEINYNQSQMINEIGQAISRQVRVESILKIVIRIFKNRLDFDRGMLLLKDAGENRLTFQTVFGYTRKELQIVKKYEFNIGRSKSMDIFASSFAEKKPYLINDVNSEERNLSSRSIRLFRELGAHSFICCPIVCNREPIGILAVDNVKTKRPLIQSDLRLLMGIASVIGIGIKNTELYGAMSQQMKSILQVLAASIDARDPYTAGHSEKVTEYSLGICRELNIPHEYTEIVGIAASLHDYGKIGISDSLLKKQGRLKKNERKIIETHAEKTRKILEQVNFVGRYNQIPEIAGAHHEKIDGSGYPRGLKGAQIPLGSKIIAVADFFEAITAKRHYRDPLPIAEAYDLLNSESGKHFDGKIVNAFLNYYKKTRIREDYNSLLGDLDRETDRTKRRLILEKIENLRQGLR